MGPAFSAKKLGCYVRFPTGPVLPASLWPTPRCGCSACCPTFGLTLPVARLFCELLHAHRGLLRFAIFGLSLFRTLHHRRLLSETRLFSPCFSSLWQAYSSHVAVGYCLWCASLLSVLLNLLSTPLLFPPSSEANSTSRRDVQDADSEIEADEIKQKTVYSQGVGNILVNFRVLVCGSASVTR